MKSWVKGGLIGFVFVFFVLWIILFSTGHDENGWKCTKAYGASYCSFIHFVFAPVHIAFVLAFSWIGFFAGIINTRIIQKLIKKGADKKTPLRITQSVVLTLVIVFAIIGLLALENWGGVMLYAVIFIIFIMALTWIIEKIKYH